MIDRDLSFSNSIRTFGESYYEPYVISELFTINKCNLQELYKYISFT